jgi:cellulose 1,4-beta-cellobiosidase
MKRLAMILALAAVAACGGKKEAGGAGSGAAPAGGSSAPAAGSGSAAAMTAPAAGSGSATAMAGSSAPAAGSAAVDVPTDTDFEANAKTTITDKNVGTELDSMEKELAQ